MNVTQQGIVTLLKSAITGEKYELPKEFLLDSEEAQKLIKKHHLKQLVYIGALNCGISSELPVMQEMFMFYCKHMIYSEKQMKEVQRVFEAFDAHGIDYLPTKGCKMKTLYPKSEMRTMGDADITIREEQCPEIEKILTELGFTLLEVQNTTDVWDSKCLHLELHRQMRSFYNEAYYDDVWERVELVGGNQYAFKTEDAFIHIFNHFARHYRGSGIGLRHVLDLYVYRRAFPQMNERYIRSEMKKIHLQKFYKNICDLLNVWFEDGEPTEVTESISEYILNSGSWGNIESFTVAQRVKEANETGRTSHFRFKYMLKLLFPNMDFMMERYKILEKVPILLPVTWILRWGKIFTDKKKYVPRLMKQLKSISDEKVLQSQKSFRAVGLDIEYENKDKQK